jgi:Spy/CpxP family protein refolding chaperone
MMNSSTENSSADSASTTRACSRQQRRHSKTFRAVVLAVVVATGVGLTAAWAQGAGPGRGFNMDRIERMTDRMTEKLGLSDEQRASIETILTASRAQAQPLQAQLAGVRGQMRQFVTAEVFDEQAMRTQLQANAATMTELMVIGARTMHDVRAQLTPEQRAEAEAMMAKFGDRRGHRDGRRDRKHRD